MKNTSPIKLVPKKADRWKEGCVIVIVTWHKREKQKGVLNSGNVANITEIGLSLGTWFGEICFC